MDDGEEANTCSDKIFFQQDAQGQRAALSSCLQRNNCLHSICRKSLSLCRQTLQTVGRLGAEAETLSSLLHYWLRSSLMSFIYFYLRHPIFFTHEECFSCCSLQDEQNLNYLFTHTRFGSQQKHGFCIMASNWQRKSNP